jgi:hypothetical protein
MILRFKKYLNYNKIGEYDDSDENFKFNFDEDKKEIFDIIYDLD